MPRRFPAARLLAVAALAATLGGTALARGTDGGGPIGPSSAGPSSAGPSPARPSAPVLLADREADPLTGKERRRACTEQWRRFSAAERAAQGPGWPQFYTRCIKRLKARAA